MVREIITISVGEGGINFGNTVWEQYCVEHNIDKSGQWLNPNEDRSFCCFFKESKKESNHFVTRNLMVDLEPNIIDNIKESKYSLLYSPESLLSGKQNAGNNFARAHYEIGTDIMDNVNDSLRTMVDECDNIQGFVINHAVGGGTGSGLGSLILERIAVDYRKKIKLGFEIYPFNNHHSKCVVEPYNALLSTHWLLDHTEVSVVFDNRKIYKLCQQHLNIANPTYNDMNLLMSKIESALTVSIRFEGELHVDLNEYQSNYFAVFPRLHFLLSSIAPIVTNNEIENVIIQPEFSKILVDGYVRHYYPYHNDMHSQMITQWEPPLYTDVMDIIYKTYSNKFRSNNDKQLYEINQLNDLFEMTCDPDYFMVECNKYDIDIHQSMWHSTNCFGGWDGKEAYTACQNLKKNEKMRFVSWCPTGFKIGLQDQILITQENDTMVSKKGVVAFSNNTMFAGWFRNRISNKYDLMYSERAFVHWYVAAGMEEGEFAEAREDMGFLEKDYLDVLSEQATDEEDEEDEED